MNIPVIQEDGTENEFEIEMCCAMCANTNYGWSVEQFCKVYERADKGEAITVPNDVSSEDKFKLFVLKT
jgi:hypothetical protein